MYFNSMSKLLHIPATKKLAAVFADANRTLFLVGGSVRDAFLGKEAFDLDFTTNAKPDEILQIVEPIAQSVWDIGKKFGTIAAQVSRRKVEITTYRADSYDGISRKPVVKFGTDILGDLHRRDFTINAIAFDVINNDLVDPCGGLEDLSSGILRTPIDPCESFSDDPLRMMRAARFSSQLTFDLEYNTFDAMSQMRDKLGNISAERLRDEFVKLILTDSPRRGIELLTESGLCEIFLPELPALMLEQDSVHRHKDVYEHSIKVLENTIQAEKAAAIPPSYILRIASLLHDIGKPKTRAIAPDGRVTFYGHDWIGAKIARKRLTKLRFSAQDTQQICKLIELHMRVYNYQNKVWTDSAVRRFVKDAGDLLTMLLILIRSDITTRNKKFIDRLYFAIDDLESRIKQLKEQEALDSIRPELNGLDVMQILDIKPGAQVGRAMQFLMNLRLDRGILGREEVTKLLLEWWNRQ